MFDLRGKYNDCRVFTDTADNDTISQLLNVLNQESVSGSNIRIMPDCHAGAGCVIGTTMTIKDKVIPNLVGVDIGCFAGETKVWCHAGYYKPIKDLAEEKSMILVESFDMSQNFFVLAQAVAIKTRVNADLVEVKYSGIFRSDITIRCTPDQKFLISTSQEKDFEYSKVEWVEAGNLKKGMRLVAEDDCIYVDSVTELAEKEDVYCLNVEETHNFEISGGIVVHNCGMHVARLKEKKVEMPNLDSAIRKNIPSGCNNRDRDGKYADKLRLDELRCITKYHAPIRVELARAANGTLGGGNHFIEIDKDKEGKLYLVVHTGSRHLGIEVCNFYQDAAYQKLKNSVNDGSKKDKINEIIHECKKEGKAKEIQKRLGAFNRTYAEKKPSICHELAYCEGELFDDYIHDMEIVQEVAYWNRQAICDIILKEMKLHLDDEFETVHNYIDTEKMILRKGSVSADMGKKLIIPMNMRDGSLICIGKGNPDWNYSAPHGAGRLFSRSKAKDLFSINDFRHEMEGIYTTSVGKGTIDESPMAYKPMDEIIKNISASVEIIDTIKPVYNFKAGTEDD